MDAKKLLIVGAAGFGTYYFWDKISNMLGITSTPPLESLQPAPSPSTTIASNGNLDKLKIYLATNPAFSSGKQGFDEYNWAFSQIGINIPKGIEDVFPGRERSNLLTVDEYYKGVHDMGLAGIIDSNDFSAFLATQSMSIGGKEYA